VLKLITVQNVSTSSVLRAQRVFPASRTVTLCMDVSTSRFKEIKACSVLRILSMEDVVAEDVVLKVDEDLSAVVPPVVVTKVGEPAEDVLIELVVEEPEAGEVAEIIEEPSAPEPVVDVTPVVIAPDVPVPDVTELEVVEAPEVPEAPVIKIISCPYCDFESPAQMGTYHHVRMKHPDKYAEYKKRVKKS